MKYLSMFSVRAALIAACALASSAYAAPTEVGIASGGTGGTNYPMVNDIAKVCNGPTLHVNNVKSDGSLDNISKVQHDRSSQYGIVQVDALVYEKGQDPKGMEKIQMVFPFFSTEIHLAAAANSPIRGLADLAGKRVVEGPEGSGTWVTAQIIKQVTKINWIGMPMDPGAAIKLLPSGGVDAVFYVAGAPVKVISETAGIKLVPMQNAAIDALGGLYTKAIIPSGGPDGKYPFLKGALTTYKVDGALVTYAYKNQYQEQISSLVTCIAKNIVRLQQDPNHEGFHAKWRDVDPLEIDRIQWPAHPAAVNAIKKASK